MSAAAAFNSMCEPSTVQLDARRAGRPPGLDRAARAAGTRRASTRSRTSLSSPDAVRDDVAPGERRGGAHPRVVAARHDLAAPLHERGERRLDLRRASRDRSRRGRPRRSSRCRSPRAAGGTTRRSRPPRRRTDRPPRALAPLPISLRSPPTTKVGSSPARSRITASIEVVVVLPWVPRDRDRPQPARPRRRAPARAPTRGCRRSRAATSSGLARRSRSRSRRRRDRRSASRVVADPHDRASARELAGAPSSPSGPTRSPRCRAPGAASRGSACPPRRCRSCARGAPRGGPARRASGCCRAAAMYGGARSRPRGLRHDGRELGGRRPASPMRRRRAAIGVRRGASSTSRAMRRREVVRAQLGVGQHLGRAGALELARVRVLMVRRSRADTGPGSTASPHTASSAMLVGAGAGHHRVRGGVGELHPVQERQRPDAQRHRRAPPAPPTVARCRGPVRTSELQVRAIAQMVERCRHRAVQRAARRGSRRTPAPWGGRPRGRARRAPRPARASRRGRDARGSARAPGCR